MKSLLIFLTVFLTEANKQRYQEEGGTPCFMASSTKFCDICFKVVSFLGNMGVGWPQI